ncbi:MAG: DUF1264 domain-containing protein [Gemmataceae bacterium]
MHRREMLAALGLGGLAMNPCHASDDHGKADAVGPMAGPHAHFCGIHMAKHNPKLQFVTQHYCVGHAEHGNDDMFQCVLYDSMEKNAKLLGVEYIISDMAYQKLPLAEKKYWHAHTYEVLGGGLIAPGMSKEEETKFMKMILPTWGKAWHTWPDPKSPIPMGEPILIWSLMGDGQVDPELVTARDKEFKCDTKAIGEQRVKAFGFERPQVGLPTSMDFIGRKWTSSGEDLPTKK